MEFCDNINYLLLILACQTDTEEIEIHGDTEHQMERTVQMKRPFSETSIRISWQSVDDVIGFWAVAGGMLSGSDATPIWKDCV